MWHLDSPIMLDKRINLYHPVPSGHVLGCHVRIPNNGINLVKIQHLKCIFFTSNGKILSGTNNRLPEPCPRYILGT